MKPKEYDVLVMAVEQGVGFGLNRAFKHVEHPTREQMEDAITQEVLNLICEWFDFEDNLNDGEKT